jgi:hypothetical protein
LAQENMITKHSEGMLQPGAVVLEVERSGWMYHGACEAC